MASITLRVHAKTRSAMWFVQVMKFMAPIIGGERALRWAEAGVMRLVRFQVDGGPWMPLSHGVPPGPWVAQDNAPDHDELDDDVKNDPVPVLPDDPEPEDDADVTDEPPTEGENP